MTVSNPLGHPPFEPELAGPLREILARRPSSLLPERIVADRQRIDATSLSDADIRRGGAFELETVTIQGPAGGIGLIVCRPTAAGQPPAVLYNMHGGGMVAGNYRSTELISELDRAQQLGLAIVGVNYRLAPEHPDPGPIEDCYAGLLWLAEHGAELGLDVGRIIVSGASAGGGLAAGLALCARDRSGPPLLGQLLLCPMVDDRCQTPSGFQLDGRGVWDRTSNITGWTALLGERRGTDEVSPYAAPARATDLSGLPPAFIDVGSAEALRDEAIAFASRIWLAGGEAELHVWSGAFHSFDEWVPDAVISQAARDARAAWLRRLLARRPAA